MADWHHRPIGEGIVAGILSGAVIAVWLFVVDVLAGHPLFTPMELGRGLFNVLALRRPEDTMATYVLAYTVFHVAAFALIGVIVAVVLHAARRTPAVLAGFVILFVAFELGFYALTVALSVNTGLGGLAWYQIGAANLVAALVMLGFMWARHPELRDELRSALEGTDA